MVLFMYQTDCKIYFLVSNRRRQKKCGNVRHLGADTLGFSLYQCKQGSIDCNGQEFANAMTMLWLPSTSNVDNRLAVWYSAKMLRLLNVNN